MTGPNLDDRVHGEDPFDPASYGVHRIDPARETVIPPGCEWMVSTPSGAWIAAYRRTEAEAQAALEQLRRGEDFEVEPGLTPDPWNL